MVKLMGIINATPDSFSDGGQFNTVESSLQQAKILINQGADILDIGAESSGPGSSEIDATTELERLKPIVQAFQEANITKQVQLSIDTYKANVANYCLQNGFTIVNDVTGLRGDPEMATTIAKHNAKVVIMYSKDDTARTSRDSVEYADIIQTIKEFLKKQTAYATKAGIKKENIIIDPGMGAFLSSKAEYSYEVINRLAELKELGFPILVGTSRKSFLGGKVNERDTATLITDTIAAYNGANILRSHNLERHTELKRIVTKINQ